MRTRDELEHLEQTDSVAFMREVEDFAAGNGDFLYKDNYEETVERMFDEADKIEYAFVKGPLLNPDGTPLTTEIANVIRDGFNAIPVSHDTKIGVMMLGLVFIVAGIMFSAVPFVSKVSEVVR